MANSHDIPANPKLTANYKLSYADLSAIEASWNTICIIRIYSLLFAIRIFQTPGEMINLKTSVEIITSETDPVYDG